MLIYKRTVSPNPRTHDDEKNEISKIDEKCLASLQTELIKQKANVLIRKNVNKSQTQYFNSFRQQNGLVTIA